MEDVFLFVCKVWYLELLYFRLFSCVFGRKDKIGKVNFWMLEIVDSFLFSYFLEPKDKIVK